MNIAELFQINVYHGYGVQILLAEFLFIGKFKKRNRFALRMAIVIPLYILLGIAVPNFVAKFVSGVFSLILFILSLAVCISLFRNKFSEILFCCTSAQFIQNLAYHLECLIHLPLKAYFNDVGWFFLSAGMMAMTYGVIYFAVIRKMKGELNIQLGNTYVFPVAILNLLFIYFIQFLFMKYGISDLWVSHLPLIICCVFGLSMQYVFLSYKDEQEEKKQLEYYLAQEHKQYEMTKENINILNMKAHDLKHHINRFQEISGYDEKELKEISEVVEEYETNIECGNSTLNYILTKSQYECNSAHITLTMMVQGKEMDFLSASDIVSIYSNILQNAIEYERIIENESLRYISLNISKKGNFIVTHIENYCEKTPQFDDGLPITTKGETVFHGIGLKSVRYVVAKYNGNLDVHFEGNSFVVNILIPISKAN